MTEKPNLLKPETYLDPGELAYVDQWEAMNRRHCEATVSAMIELIGDEGPQSVALWANLLQREVDAEHLSAMAAYLLIAESQRRIEAGNGAKS